VLSSDSQLAQDLAHLLPTWVIPNGVIFNPNDRQITFENVTRLEMTPTNESDFSFCWKDIFSQNLYGLDLNFTEPLMRMSESDEYVHLSKKIFTINSINSDNFFDKFDKFQK
jgi:hypothetical protein